MAPEEAYIVCALQLSHPHQIRDKGLHCIIQLLPAQVPQVTLVFLVDLGSLLAKPWLSPSWAQATPRPNCG